MRKRVVKLLLWTIAFGSIWGLLELTLGDYLRDIGMPAGVIMTAVVGLILLTVSRVLFKQRGMQLAIGAIAAGLVWANPVGGCLLCSVIAIAAESVIFELIWLIPKIDNLSNTLAKVSAGVITGYCCYTLGFVVTQIATPALSAAGFHLSDLAAVMPQILAKGALAGLIGGTVFPLALLVKDLDISTVRDRLFYPAAAAIAGICWLIPALL